MPGAWQVTAYPRMLTFALMLATIGFYCAVRNCSDNAFGVSPCLTSLRTLLRGLLCLRHPLKFFAKVSSPLRLRAVPRHQTPERLQVLGVSARAR